MFTNSVLTLICKVSCVLVAILYKGCLALAFWVYVGHDRSLCRSGSINRSRLEYRLRSIFRSYLFIGPELYVGEGVYIQVKIYK